MRKFPKLMHPAILSPMAGVTDVAFRVLCRRYGAGMTCTEFVSSAALARNSEAQRIRENPCAGELVPLATKRMLATDPSEKPVAVQLFGANAHEVVAAAQSVEQQFDVIDMNCGCPAYKVIKTGAGSALLNEPHKIAKLVEEVAAAVKRPVTIKIRSGIDERHINAVEVAKAAEAAGAAAIAVHGRTQRQGYSGIADWRIVKAVKDAVQVPVIGNGDVFSARDFIEKRAASGCDYVMVARGAIGNPGIFAEINAAIKGEETAPASAENRISLFFEYFDLARKYEIPFAQLKTHASSFTKGVRGGSRLREQIARAKNEEELLRSMRSVVSK
jgi:nifR3 family TIM-barrel protein